MTLKRWLRVTAMPVGKVMEVIDLDESLTPGKDIFHKEWVFVDATSATAEVAPGWLISNGVFSAPPVVSDQGMTPEETFSLAISTRE